jgi:hypothetical protein
LIMPATGFYTRSSEDGGSPATSRIGSAAGTVIDALDALLTEGPSPWSKVINGTNDVTYTAPGGSGASLNVLDNTAHSSNYFVRLRMFTGGSPSFQVPTPTQETTSGQGYVYVRARGTTSTASTGDPDWFGVRTDRMCLFHIGIADTAQYPGNYFAFGDFPTLSPNDPGLTGILALTTTITATTTVNDTTSAQNAQSEGSFQHPTTPVGYVDVAYDGFIGPVAATVQNQFQPAYQNVTYHNGDIPLGRVWIVTADATTDTNLQAQTCSMRGYIPYAHSIPIYGGPASGITNRDTFSDANGAQYQLRAGYNNSRFIAVMTSNDEDLP